MISKKQMIGFIETNRFKLNNYASMLIHNLKLKFKDIIVPIRTTRLYLNGQSSYTVEPEVYLTGGMAYITYDTFSRNRMSPMVYNAPATYDWDITVHLKEKLTFEEQLDIFHLFQTFLEFIPGLKCDMPNVDENFQYYNFDFYILFNDVAYNIFEVSFKPNPYIITYINILHINEFLPLPAVPDLLSLMSLSLIAIDIRGPIKIKHRFTGKLIKNDKFYKCIQDYYRIIFILRTLDLYRADLIPTQDQLKAFNKLFNHVMKRYPHCTTNIFKMPKMNQIDQEKKNGLSDKLWQAQQSRAAQKVEQQARLKQAAQKVEQQARRKQAARVEQQQRYYSNDSNDSDDEYFQARQSF